MEVTMKGTLAGYQIVWYNKRSLTNILSLHNIKKKYTVTYDNSDDDRFVVHKQDRKLYFTCSKNGLYFHDMRNRQVSMINMVEEN